MEKSLKLSHCPLCQSVCPLSCVFLSQNTNSFLFFLLDLNYFVIENLYNNIIIIVMIIRTLNSRKCNWNYNNQTSNYYNWGPKIFCCFFNKTFINSQDFSINSTDTNISLSISLASSLSLFLTFLYPRVWVPLCFSLLGFWTSIFIHPFYLAKEKSAFLFSTKSRKKKKKENRFRNSLFAWSWDMKVQFWDREKGKFKPGEVKWRSSSYQSMEVWC